MKLSVIIPAYNEADSITGTIKELSEILSSLSLIDKFQIIVIDDHSSDNTFETVSKLGDARVSCLRLSKHCGSHTAIRAGMREANGEAVLFVSADGQDDVSYLEQMLLKLRGGSDVVWALRKDRENEPWHIKFPARLFYALLGWFNRNESGAVDLSRADFYLLNRKVADAVNSCSEKNTSVFGLISWLGFKQDFVEYGRRKRRIGKSKWNLQKRFKLAMDWIIAFSGLPLKFISFIGMIVASCGFIYAGYIITSALRGIPTPGWASTMVVILVLGGIQMIMLGLIGEYLWRNIEESRNRPLYFIEKDSSKSGK